MSLKNVELVDANYTEKTAARIANSKWKYNFGCSIIDEAMTHPSHPLYEHHHSIGRLRLDVEKALFTTFILLRSPDASDTAKILACEGITSRFILTRMQNWPGRTGARFAMDLVFDDYEDARSDCAVVVTEWLPYLETIETIPGLYEELRWLAHQALNRLKHLIDWVPRVLLKAKTDADVFWSARANIYSHPSYPMLRLEIAELPIEMEFWFYKRNRLRGDEFIAAQLAYKALASQREPDRQLIAQHTKHVDFVIQWAIHKLRLFVIEHRHYMELLRATADDVNSRIAV